MSERSPIAPAQRETWLVAANVAELRLSGFTLHAIGDYLDMSHQRVSQLVPWGAALLIHYTNGLRA